MIRLVLLSGWAIDARIWSPLASHWGTSVTVEAIDWPGMGGRPALADAGASDADASDADTGLFQQQAHPSSGLQALAKAMGPSLSSRDGEPVIWVGWSLGALQAAALTRHLPAPDGLVLLGMGPTFCHPNGVTTTALADFRAAFRRDPTRAREHFLRWQLSGEPTPRDALRRLRSLLTPDIGADHATLEQGLATLAGADIGDLLGGVPGHVSGQAPDNATPVPVTSLCGATDPLLAPAVRAAMDERIEGAGHCPMLSQPARLAEAIQRHALRMLDKGKAPTSRSGPHYGDREDDDADRDATDADREVQGFDEVTP
ncbi:MAG: alpha/beta fold hydrolase [Gammaproteobacteria bacterium]|nr:alpha/beta fold hydrolase [Gammaproteobacteria bacterium]